MADNIYAFAEMMRAAGLEPPEHIEPGRFHRFRGIGKRNGNKAGWCKLFDDGMGGSFGDYSNGLSESWQAEREQPFTEGERAAFQRQVAESRKQAEAQRLAEQEQAATQARQRWEAARPANPGNPYLVKKHIKPHGTRQEGDKLLIPLRDESGHVWALQTIGPDGGKLFSPAGCRTKGLYFSIGQPAPGGPACTAEGFATGAAIHEATGWPVACAMTAGNLEAGARIIKGKLPGHQIVVCADDDSKPDTEKNPGIEAATKAALAVGGVVAVPGLGRKADFWDLWNERGADAVRQAIETTRPVQDDQSKFVEAGANQGQPPAGDQDTGAPTAGGSDRVRPLGIHEFLSFEFPPRENLLSPWLPSQGLAMVYAARGIGKTHFALGVAYAVASGGRYLGWRSPTPAGVLYIDGEMPGAVMQERLAAIAASNDLEAVAPFEILNPDLQPNGMPRIDTPDGQAKIESILTPEIKLIIIDNISTLTQTKENEADGWTPVQAWALRQRSMGRSVLFVHHAGKGGQQRGTSRREDVLDTVLSLRRPVDYHPDQGAVFEVHFEKARGIYGDDVKPIEASLTTSDDGLNIWATRTVEAGTFDRVVQLLNEGMKQHEIVVELGVNKSTISRHVKRAKAEGLAVAA